jgi:hypothetical protein
MMQCQSQRATNPNWVVMLFLLVLLQFVPAVSAFDVTLAWDSNPEPDLARYKVYVGTRSFQYDTVLDAGLETQKVIPSLEPGRTYYFAVSATLSNGIESELSAEVTYTLPIDGTNAWSVPLKLSFSASPSIPMVSYAVSQGAECFVQASEDLRTWQTVHITPPGPAGTVHWSDENAVNFPKRFYRIIAASP